MKFMAIFFKLEIMYEMCPGIKTYTLELIILKYFLVPSTYWILDRLLFFSISMVTKRFHYPKTLPKEDVVAFRVFVPKALSTFLFV